MSDENINISQSLCPKCGEPADLNASHCPHCGEEFSKATETSQSITPEILTRNLGDFLVENGVITKKQLKRAKEYQRQTDEKQTLLGQALLELGFIDRDTLDKAITSNLSALYADLQEANNQLERRIELHKQNLDSRLLQIRTSAEITQLTISAKSQNELLRRTAELIVEQLGYCYASVFLVDKLKKYATLAEATSSSKAVQIAWGYRVETGSSSIIGWVMDNLKSYVIDDVQQDSSYLKFDSLTDIQSEIALPVMTSDRLFAILDIQHTTPNAFDPETVMVLQTIANHIAAALQNSRLLEDTQISLREISALYQASLQFAKASTHVEVQNSIFSALRRLPYLSAFFLVDGNGLRLISDRRTDQTSWGGHPKEFSYPDRIDLDADLLQIMIGTRVNYKIIDISDTISPDQTLPPALYSVPSSVGCSSLALIPGWNEGKLELLVVLGAQSEIQFTQGMLEPYCNLVNMALITLSKVRSLQHFEKRMAVLQMLNTVSQSVSIETDLNTLYKAVHQGVTAIVGKVNIAIAIYDERLDSITIPYMYDGHTKRSVEAFPMGEGLTSILIKTKKSLMLVHDVEKMTLELGAKQVGKPAKSWLGAPMIVGGDVYGAIILQDLEQEGRFDEDDQRLLEALAEQVAVALRATRMLEVSYKQAVRQQQLYEITNKIRGSSDLEGIMQTTVSELSRALGARGARITVGIPSSNPQETKPSHSQELS